MPDSQNKNSIRNNSIDDSPVPDAICIQSFELTCQCFAGFWIFCKSGFYLMDYSFCNRSVNILQVIQDRSLVINPDCQGGVSTPVSYTHLRAHETDSYLVCRLLLEKKQR